MSRPLFKKSALADKADKVWSESKTEFNSTHQTHSDIKLEKKTLTDVLDKLKTEKKDNEPEKVSFVFGSKLNERTIKSNEGKEENCEEEAKPLTASEMFKSARSTVKPEISDGENFRALAKEEAEKSKELEKQHASTSVVEITTGEEKESAIFQASCKMHAFDKEKKIYVEKGVCELKINETTENGRLQHRIIARTKGTLKIVINSKVFTDMIVEKVDKRVKISAIGADNSGLQIFLIKFGFSKTDSGADCEKFLDILGGLLKLEKGEQCRKRKADCEVKEETQRLKDSKMGTDSEQGTSNVENEDDGFVLVEKPNNDEEGTEEEEESTNEA